MRLTLIADSRFKNSKQDKLLQEVYADNTLPKSSKSFINNLITNNLTGEISRQQVADTLRLSPTRVSNLLKGLKNKSYCNITYGQSKKLTIKFKHLNKINNRYGVILNRLFMNPSLYSKFLIENFIFNSKTVENESGLLPQIDSPLSYYYIYSYRNELFNINNIISFTRDMKDIILEKKIVNLKQQFKSYDKLHREDTFKKKKEYIISDIYNLSSDFIRDVAIGRVDQDKIIRYIKGTLKEDTTLKRINQNKELLLAVVFGYVKYGNLTVHVDLQTLIGSLYNNTNWQSSLYSQLQIKKLSTVLKITK